MHVAWFQLDTEANRQRGHKKSAFYSIIMQWRCSIHTIVNIVNICVCVCVYVHIHLAFSTCLVATILNCTDNRYIFYSQTKIYNTNAFSAELSLSLSCSISRQNEMKCVLCACGECECKPAHSFIYAGTHTSIHACAIDYSNAKAKQCNNCGNDAMRWCCWTALNRILQAMRVARAG